jgi:ABC1 atypical kinase-like domain
MVRLRPVRSPEGERRARQVERHLADLGFAPPERRFQPAGAEPESAGRLSRALQGLGPVLASFGRYLASRPDLLPVADCLVLAGIPDAGEPSATEDRIAAELGSPPAELFASFEEEPFDVRLLHQSHRAWLATGQEVVVRVIHPGLEERIALDAGLLPLLRPALPAGFPLEEAAADFRLALADGIDLALAAEALEGLGRSAADGDLPVAPEVHRRLTATGVLTLSPLRGDPLAAAACETTGEEAVAYDLARRILLFWLRQALTSRKLSLEADLVLLPGGRLGCDGGTFTDVDGASQTNLWEYLRATAAHEPERIFACLVRELVAPPRGEARGDLRKRLRQVVPFGEERPGASRESLIEHLTTHWRLIRQCGYRPQPHLLAFYQGLFWASRTGWLLAPTRDPLRDPLRDALDDLRWLDGWAQVQQLTDPRRVAEMAEGYLATLAVLPQQIEQALDRLTRDGGLSHPRAAGPPDRRREARNTSTAALALGLAMAAVALVTARLASLPGGPGARAETVGALVFFLLGALMLWIVTSRPARRRTPGKKR